MMTVGMGFHVVIVKAQGPQVLHVSYAERGIHVLALLVLPAAARNFAPWCAGKLRNRLIGLAAECYIAIQLA